MQAPPLVGMPPAPKACEEMCKMNQCCQIFGHKKEIHEPAPFRHKEMSFKLALFVKNFKDTFFLFVTYPRLFLPQDLKERPTLAPFGVIWQHHLKVSQPFFALPRVFSFSASTTSSLCCCCCKKICLTQSLFLLEKDPSFLPPSPQ